MLLNNGKNSIFSGFLGGGGAPGTPPPLNPPLGKGSNK